MHSEPERRGRRTFFAPAPWPAMGGEVTLPPGEARHAGRVVRVRAGERLRLVDGEGRVAEAEVVAGAPATVRVRLTTAVRWARAPRPALELAVPWIRALARLDWVIEKGTELGVARFHLYAAERSLPGRARAGEARLKRWRELARAAMKQSARAWWPAIERHASLAALCAQIDPADPLWVGDPGGEAPVGCGAPLPPERIWLLVGPEGGLTEAERRGLEARRARSVVVGRHRLRTETAAIALVALCAALHLGEATGEGT